MTASGARLRRAWLAALGAHVAMLAAACASGPASPEQSRAIAGVLDAMRIAVLAGDQEAYLAHVAADEPHFLQEQRNWARDLSRHVPVEFEMHIDGSDVEIDGGLARADIRMTWRLEGWPQPRSVAWPGSFTESDAGAWLYAGEAWERVEGEGIVTLCAPGLGAVGERAVRVFPAVRAHVEEGFGIAVPRVQVVKLYRSMAHLQSSIYLSYVDSLGGWNEPGESIKVLADGGTGSGALRVVLAHEFAHVATFEMGPCAAAMPWWLVEGVAELAAERFAGGDAAARLVDDAVRGWAAAEMLRDWDELADFHAVPVSLFPFVYKQGQHLLGFISESWGREARNRWIASMARCGQIDDATRDVLGIPFDDLDRRWRASVAP
jgi:hypothetical protein